MGVLVTATSALEVTVERIKEYCNIEQDIRCKHVASRECLDIDP